jgi:hypothetical protein
VLDLKIETAASGVAWVDADRVAVAGPDGVRLFAPATKKWTDLIPPLPVPEGLPDPLSVSSDGKSLIASNSFLRAQYALRLSDRKRLLARSSSTFMVLDAAIAGDRLFVLGWPTGPRGAANPDGIAVWSGDVSPYFQKLLPFHRIQGGPKSVDFFNDSIAPIGGSISVERDGTVDVVTAAEPGIYQYDATGRLLRVVGSGLDELVQPQMHDINFTYSSDELARYRKVINARPSIEDLVATADGPAIVVRIAREGNIEWELWYPSASRTRARLKLGVSRKGPFGHMSCDARSRELVCVYHEATTERQGLDPRTSEQPAHLVRFKLPPVAAEKMAVKQP